MQEQAMHEQAMHEHALRGSLITVQVKSTNIKLCHEVIQVKQMNIKTLS